ncbi:UNVERIFIED_CONTAM: hypothetical protein PYX00_000357 [Menopon gallinae]|uniref:CS domain-containing protein n=1 Tax=Menopon gallinae TaxID=328185 RepID=A0AAW2I9Y8_9NEOP
MQTDCKTPILHKKQTFGETFCGADRGTYKWCQTISDLDIVVPVPPEIKAAADIGVETTCEKLKVKVRNVNDDTWSSIIDGSFPFKTRPSEMMWNLEKGKHINIHIEKVQERWWDSLVEEEPKINLEEFELSRPVTDLTDEEEMTLQKIWSKQLEKKNGPERSPHS